jgi:glycogen operon protein
MLLLAVLGLLGACSSSSVATPLDAGEDGAAVDGTGRAPGRPDTGPHDAGSSDARARDGSLDSMPRVDAAGLDASNASDGSVSDGATSGDTLGGIYDAATASYTFTVKSTRATRIEVDLFAAALNAGAVLTAPLTMTAPDTWSVTIPASQVATAGITGTVLYGYRAWGPNWPYDPTWTPGSSVGFLSDWDATGNTFNPNKLLIDPYAREISHDPLTPQFQDGSIYVARGADRALDSALAASKSLVLTLGPLDTGTKPSGARTDDVIYEVHVRGLTMNDPSVTSCAGTYAGAAEKAASLAALGVTAIELLPIEETQNDLDDVAPSTTLQNYWGYSTLADFAPDRRYACDQSAGGPTRELAAMVKAFHDAGLKVLLDVVYNHTAEGGGQALHSFRGLDNATYYELTTNAQAFVDQTGIGANYNVASPIAAQVVLDSLQYFANDLGIDGFRFDEAAELGNSCLTSCYTFDATSSTGLLQRIVAALPGEAIIAEPWAVGNGTYQVGHFPDGWSEWNGPYRDGIRTLENKLNVVATPLSQLADEWSGSPSLYSTRSPAASINYVVSHDGFTLHDEFACNAPNNTQAWPYGPSSGGATDENQWDQEGVATAQAQAERTAIALMATSTGPFMITGGDELGRTVKCNDNPYNLDSTGNWLDWSAADPTRTAFVTTALATRNAHASLHPPTFPTGTDHNGNGRVDVEWLEASGATATSAYLANTAETFLAFERDASEFAGDPAAAILVAYDSNDAAVTWTLPAAPAGTAWYRAIDTGTAAADGSYAAAPGSEIALGGTSYDVVARSVVVLIAK